MFVLLTALWPLFALIVAGYVLRARGFPGDGFWPGAERLNYFVLFPALLFHSLSIAPLDNPALPRLVSAVALALGVCWTALFCLRRLRGWPGARFGVLLQGGLRFNTYLGLAAVGSLYGAPGLALSAILLALLVPAVNVLSVLAFSDRRQAGWRSLLWPVLKNPLILACVAGILANVLGLTPRWGLDRLLALLAAVSLPLGLLCVGAALRPQELRGEGLTLALNSLGRLLAAPAVAAAVAWLLGLPALESAMLVVFFALPTAPTAYVLTRQMQGESQLMAGIITLQTLLSAISLPLVLSLLR